jgi:hypothetical protein
MAKKTKMPKGKKVNPKKINPPPKQIPKQPVKKLSYKTGSMRATKTVSKIKRYTKTIKKRK